MQKVCPMCGKEFETNSNRRKYCSTECKELATKIKNKLRARTPEYKEKMKKWRETSEAYKQAQYKYQHSEKFKKTRKAYQQTESYKETVKKHSKTEKYKETMKRYYEKRKANNGKPLREKGN
jgi:hypothetical protein